MKNDILVVGAGGHCRTVLSIISHYRDLNVVGIADRDKENVGEKILDHEVKYSWEDFQDVYEEGVSYAAIAVGDNKERNNLFTQLEGMGFIMKTLIHPSASIDDTVTIGVGCTICMGVIIGPSVTIGDNCVIYTGAIIDHEVAIDDDCFIAPGVCIAGRVLIGNGCFIGIGSSIIENITIGTNAIVGAGSAVIHDIPSNVTVAGIPAKGLN
jgi:UDP-perosamine 4-acetyltransferase|tara:strand:+ start:2485 stop:3117 length:633 start_codon:yes stop_codon:yes gene_type:complete